MGIIFLVYHRGNADGSGKAAMYHQIPLYLNKPDFDNRYMNRKIVSLPVPLTIPDICHSPLEPGRPCYGFLNDGRVLDLSGFVKHPGGNVFFTSLATKLGNIDINAPPKFVVIENSFYQVLNVRSHSRSDFELELYNVETQEIKKLEWDKMTKISVIDRYLDSHLEFHQKGSVKSYIKRLLEAGAKVVGRLPENHISGTGGCSVM